MLFTELSLKGAYIITPELITDNRGFFTRVFCEEQFKKFDLEHNFVQSNMSYNFKKYTLRGMHYQINPYEEVKLVRCIQGSIYDVIIDLRRNSSTYKKWVGMYLSHNNGTMIYVPKGFAHGYMALEDQTEVLYWVSEFYTKVAERGIHYNDPQFSIAWPHYPIMVSDKDMNHTPYMD